MNNDFWSQALASLIGAFGAFVLSVFLFFITQSVRNRSKKRELAANTAVEIETDIGMLEEIKSQIDDLCQEIEIETNKAKLYVPMRFAEVIYSFIGQAYAEGLLRELLSSIELIELQRITNRNSKQTDDVNIYALDQYKTDVQDQAETLRLFRAEKKQIEKDIKFLNDIYQRLSDYGKGKKEPKK
jgi:hypothetical protein